MISEGLEKAVCSTDTDCMLCTTAQCYVLQHNAMYYSTMLCTTAQCYVKLCGPSGCSYSTLLVSLEGKVFGLNDSFGKK